MQSVDIKKGDKVITSPFSFVASANSILLVGAEPVFVDIDVNTLKGYVKALEIRVEKTIVLGLLTKDSVITIE